MEQKISTFVTRKSYLITLGLSPEHAAQLTSIGRKNGFQLVHVGSIPEAQEAFSKISHCIGLILGVSATPSLVSEAQLWANDRYLQIQKLTGEDLEKQTSDFLRALFPEKLKELCEFSINKIFPVLVSDLDLSWKVVNEGAALSRSSFMVSCECMATHFIGNISIRSDFGAARKRSAQLSEYSDEMILNFFAEIGNEVMGVITRNLLKIKITAEMGLPVFINANELGGLEKRSSYYLPTLRLQDEMGDLEVVFSFLVPFLREAEVDRAWQFEVGMESQEQTVDFF